MWDVITHPYLNLNAFEDIAWISNYFPLLDVYAMTYPCQNPDVGLSYLC